MQLPGMEIRMNHLDWYQTLSCDDNLNSMLPMEWQPCPPMPLWKNGQLFLYIPYQRVWMEENQLCCSPKLGELWFQESTGRLVAFRNLQILGEADAEELFASRALAEDEIYRSNLVVERLLAELDKLEKYALRNHKVEKQQLEEYYRLLEKGLLFPEQLSLYEDVAL